VYVWSGGLFSKTEMSEVLTEILKVDPSFDKDVFLKQCEFDIIPNVLEVKKYRSSLDIGAVQIVLKAYNRKTGFSFRAEDDWGAKTIHVTVVCHCS
jgi:hypothetical protein